jgi:hypothetical protein
LHNKIALIKNNTFATTQFMRMEPKISKLVYRPNSCPICLKCIECNEFYGSSCACESREIYWNKKSEGYCVDFRHKALIDTPQNKKLKLDPIFVIWFFENISSQIEILENQNDVNVCHKCVNKFDYFKSLYQSYQIFN